MEKKKIRTGSLRDAENARAVYRKNPRYHFQTVISNAYAEPLINHRELSTEIREREGIHAVDATPEPVDW